MRRLLCPAALLAAALATQAVAQAIRCDQPGLVSSSTFSLVGSLQRVAGAGADGKAEEYWALAIASWQLKGSMLGDAICLPGSPAPVSPGKEVIKPEKGDAHYQLRLTGKTPDMSYLDKTVRVNGAFELNPGTKRSKVVFAVHSMFSTDGKDVLGVP